ncbi:hypothetical protein QTO34_000784 [Cnephaeus nilssonii]|uniref:Uncharacterized protein n=1 Tax=Cnephaeus nilssonii TaxID=3371016 RepID=A0AA40IC38_CNENI|nr:hypothetical protein QTO34_000784 [Eptesicus nilssonii]
MQEVHQKVEEPWGFSRAEDLHIIVSCQIAEGSSPNLIISLKNIYFIDFLQRGRERDRELETSMREKHQSAASCTPPTGDVPTTKGHVASPGPRGCVASSGPRCAWLHLDPGPSLSRIQGHTASPGPGIQLHPDPGACDLTRTQGRTQGHVASPRSRGPRPHPDPGPSLTRIQGHTASPSPRIQLHPDPGADGLTQTQGRVASPGPGTQPHPDPGAHGLARTQDLASPGPRGTWWCPQPIRREYANCCHALKDGSAHRNKMVVPSPFSPARVAGLAQGAGKPRMAASQLPRAARGSGPARDTGKPRMAAAQLMPKMLASLRCQLPSRPVVARCIGKPWLAVAQLPRAGLKRRKASDGGCPATQSRPKGQASLRWWLPSRPGPPEAQPHSTSQGRQNPSHALIRDRDWQALAPAKPRSASKGRRNPSLQLERRWGLLVSPGKVVPHPLGIRQARRAAPDDTCWVEAVIGNWAGVGGRRAAPDAARVVQAAIGVEQACGLRLTLLWGPGRHRGPG